MQQKVFIEKCMDSGLSVSQAKTCYKLFEVSGSLPWSYEKAKKNLVPDQLQQLKMGFTKGLSIEEVDVYAKANFSPDQMEEARNGFDAGLSIAQVSKYYKQEFDWSKMAVARKYIGRLGNSGFEAIYRTEYSADQMEAGVTAYLTGSTGVRELFSTIYDANFTAEQMKLAFSSVAKIPAINAKNIGLFYKKELTVRQMQELIAAIESGVAPENIARFNTAEFSWDRMQQLRLAAEAGLEAEEMTLLANSEYNADQIRVARHALQGGLPIASVKVFFSTEYSLEQMSSISSAYSEGLEMELVKFIANPKYSWAQMNQAILGFTNGLSVSEVSLYYKTEYTVNQMDGARRCLQASERSDSGLNVEFARFLLETDLSAWQVGETVRAFLDGATLENVIEQLSLDVNFEEEEQGEYELNGALTEDREILKFFNKVSKQGVTA